MFQFLFYYILERKDKKSFKRDIIVLISFLILFVSISFLVNIGKEMSLPGFRIGLAYHGLTGWFLLLRNFSVAVSVSPRVCFILVLIFISMFLR